MREHDPALCDYVVVEEHMERGRSVVSSVRFPLGDDDNFEDEEDTGVGWRHTMIGLPVAARRPAPSVPQVAPVCKNCGAPYVDQLTPGDEVPDVFCDGRCELDVEL